MLKKIILSLAVCASLISISHNISSVRAATREDVIEAARNSCYSDSQVQVIINIIQTNPDYTSEDYDKMIIDIQGSGSQANGGINDGLTENDPVVKIPSSDPSSEQTEKNYSSLTPEEKKEYIDSLTPAEKNQILKGLDKDKQLEILKGLIDSSSAFGMNVTIDEMTDENIKYSIRNESGKLVESASIGIVVDDTGLDYTYIIAGAFSLVAFSCYGIYILSKDQKRCHSIDK